MSRGLSRRDFITAGAIGVTALVATQRAAPPPDPPRILVAYASQAGSTAGVAAAIGEQLELSGAHVDVRPAREGADLSKYTGVVLGSAIHHGRPLRDATAFLQNNRALLATMPLAIFCVSGMLANDSAATRRRAAGWLASLRALAVAPPVSEAAFAGELAVYKYRLLSGLGIRGMAFLLHKAPGDYRDWVAIRAWADDLATRLALSAG